MSPAYQNGILSSTLPLLKPHLLFRLYLGSTRVHSTELSMFSTPSSKEALRQCMFVQPSM